MPIPTEVVGSLPRPSVLQEAFAQYDQGTIKFEELQALQDKACEDSIRHMVEAGEPVVTDGEQRSSSFATYPITDTLGGTGLAKNLAADGQYFAIFDDGHHRQLPRLTGGPFRYKTFASDYFTKSSQGVKTPMKQAVIDLNNRVIDRFSPEERKNIGIHTCPGGDCDSVHSFDVPYENLLPSMFKMNAGYFLIQCASESDKDKVYKLIGENIRKDANGVKQVAFIGVINPLNPVVETPEQVADTLVHASKYISKDQLGATDDCGFSPFSIDVKPKHGSPDFAREVAFKKIASRIQGAKMASERLGI